MSLSGLKVYGKDEWNQEKYGIKAQRTWRKLYLAIDENQQILASDLTEKSVGDTSALDMLDQIYAFDTFMADSAYDGDRVYAQILKQQSNANIIIPPPKNAVPNASAQPIRNQHVDFINNAPTCSHHQSALAEGIRSWSLTTVIASLTRYGQGGSWPQSLRSSLTAVW